MEQVFPAANVTGQAGHTASVRAGILRAVNAGQIVDAYGAPAYVPGTSECAAAAGTGTNNNLKLVQMGSGLALQGTAIALSAAGVATAAALAPITFGISALIGLLPLFLNHHSQAVKAEQSTLCTAVPAANNYLKVIDQAVMQGLATPQQGIDALNSLLSDFRSQVASIEQGAGPGSSGNCNAACVQIALLQAIVAYKASQYQDLITGTQQAVQPSRPNTTSAAGTTVPASSYSSFYAQAPPAAAAVSPAPASSSSWLPIAAVGLLAFLLFRG